MMKTYADRVHAMACAMARDGWCAMTPSELAQSAIKAVNAVDAALAAAGKAEAPTCWRPMSEYDGRSAVVLWHTAFANISADTVSRGYNPGPRDIAWVDLPADLRQTEPNHANPAPSGGEE